MAEKTLMQICAVLLILILGVVVVQGYHPKHQTIGEKVDEAVEEVQDEIDDHTTTK